jgi:hypothetical protein
MTFDTRARTAGFACAVAAATLLAVAGCANGAGPSAPSTTTPPATVAAAAAATDSSTTVYGVGLDALEEGSSLRTTEGTVYHLPDKADYAVRVPLGWLYGRSKGASTVYLLTADGTSHSLTATINLGQIPRTPVLSADGDHIAWATEGAVHTGRIATSGLTEIIDSPVQSDTYPLTWVGTRVILSHTYAPGCCGYGKVERDVWEPSAGTFVPHWTRGLDPIYGPVPGGLDVFAVQETSPPAEQGCLVRLNAVKDLSSTATTCLPGLMIGSLMWSIAPDGRHVVDFLGNRLDMFDLTTVAGTPAPLHSCLGDEPLAWENNDTLLTVEQGSPTVYRCAVDDAKSGPVTGRNLSTDIRFVPRVGLS